MNRGVVDETVELRPVRSVIDHLHRSLVVADDARAGRFTHCDMTLALGRQPDWRGGGLANDDEWRIEWVKLYEGLDLAHAYAVTGEHDYLATWEDLVESFCDQIPVGMDSSDVSARRAQNWLYAWQRLRGAPHFVGLRDGLAARLRARLAADGDHLRAHLTAERNHRTLELYTLVMLGLAFDDRSTAADALALLADNAERDIWPDGVHRECSSDYHCLVLRSLLGAVANATDAGLCVPAPLAAAAERACTFALHLQRPDGTTPALSDGDEGDYRPLLALGAEVLDRGDLRWAATGGCFGVAPAERTRAFRTGGYVSMRSGWGDATRDYRDERWAVFDVGPLGDGGHGHYDQLSVELYGAGSPLFVDPGRFTYAEEPEGWRRWFKGTAAHNTVTVDDLDQVPYRRGKPKGPLPAARLVGLRRTERLDVAMGVSTSPCHDAVHRRTLCLVDGDYWVVRDRLRSPSVHRYTLRWHLPAAACEATELTASGDRCVITSPMVRLDIFGAGATAQIEPGWVSPRYGYKQHAPVVAVTCVGADVDLVTVAYPAPTS